MKEYLMNKYKEHYLNMVKYMKFYDLAAQKKVEYEYGACSAVANALTDMGLATTSEVIKFRDTFGGVRL